MGQELTVIYASRSELKDSDVQVLANALKKNSVFEGNLVLSENYLTDLSVLYLTEALEESKCKVYLIDLSMNNLKDKSGVYLGNLIASGYPVRQIFLKGCEIGTAGVQRIFETIEHSELQVVDIGVVRTEGLGVIGSHIARSDKIKQVSFQQGESWTAEAKRDFIRNIRSNFSVLLYEIEGCDSQEFVDEVCSVADRNNSLNDRKSDEREQDVVSDPSNFAEDIQNLIENNLQSLPVRVYLNNAIGTLLNDGIYALMKYRYKENNSSKNTAVNNIKWLVRYILDNTRN